MSNYLKPQSPLRDKSSGDFFYPLTTEDQVIMNDGNRLSGTNFLSVEKYSAAEGEIPLNNADTLGGYSADEFVRHIQLQNTPKAGFIYPLASDIVPDGFLLCDGAAYSRTEYPELFAAIGTMYGEGDGSTTFNVPDLATRVPVGSGENYELGSTGGEEVHTLTIDEMPSHTHKVGRSAYLQGGGAAAGYEASGTFDNAGITLSTGGSQPHNNMQPYTVVNYIIATGKDTGVSIADIILGAQALPLGVEYGGTGATNAIQVRKNLEVSHAIESTEHPNCYYRMVDGEAEWLNPPLVLGEQYRTTERYNGKAVYVTTVDCGAIVTGGNKTISVTYLNATSVFQCNAMSSAGSSIPHRYSSDHYSEIYASHNNIILHCGTGVAGWSVTAYLWYTKD